MADEPHSIPQDEKQEADQQNDHQEPTTRDLIHKLAEAEPETHADKRERFRKEILDSIGQTQGAGGEAGDTRLESRIQASYDRLDGHMRRFWAPETFTGDRKIPTRITDDGTKIYVLDHDSSISSLVGYNPEKQEIYQIIQLAPVDGKVKIIGLLYTPQGFEMTETEADAEEFENEHAMWEIVGSDNEEKNKLRKDAPILGYFDDISSKLHSSDSSLPFFVKSENIKVLNRDFFPNISEHPEHLTGTLPEFARILPTRTHLKPAIPTDNDPESVKIREIHYVLEGLVGEIEETFHLAAANRPGSKINYLGSGKVYREIAGRDERGYRYMVRRKDERNDTGEVYSIYKKRPDKSVYEDFIDVFVIPGGALYGAIGGGDRDRGYGSSPVGVEDKTRIYEFYHFLKDLQKTLRKEAKSNNG